MKNFWNKIKRFRPPVVLSCVLGVVFSAASLVVVATDFGMGLPSVAHYIIYVCGAVFLTLALWAVVWLCRRASPGEQFRILMHRTAWTGRIHDDFHFRTMVFTGSSLALNVIYAAVKGITGWLSTSWWLISLSAYYLILCIVKAILLSENGKLSSQTEATQRMKKEWRVYRMSGIMLLMMTIVLLGMVVLIMRAGSTFAYDGMLIYVMAMWDFYSLGNVIYYMVRCRKQHTPIIVAIKTVKFATALVSILSLQTAMFASFGGSSDGEYQSIMNMITGTAVCVLMLVIGLIMIIKSSKAINTNKKSEVSR